MIMITSSKNQILKIVKSLKMKKSRDINKMFFIEGTRFFNEALAAEREIINIFLSETFSKSTAAAEIKEDVRLKNTLIYVVTDEIFKSLSDTENPQGILAVLETFQNKDNDILKNAEFIIVLDSLQDPGNVGTIIRTADAAGVDALILSKNCADIFNPKVLRSTMGSVFHVPILQSENITEIIKMLKLSGVKIFASHLGGKKDFYKQDLSGRVAFVIGNEANGLKDEIIEMADEIIRIPMPGKTESLNASVAASVIMYERVRQTTN